MRRRLAPTLIIAGVVASVGLLIGLLPVMLGVEEAWGLDLLFRFRGPRQPPAEVLVVSIDKESAERLGVSPDPARWPRSLHARLLERLGRRGAGVVAFDIVFEQPGAADDDAVFAQALDRGRNAVLGQYLVRATTELPGGGTAAGTRLIVEQTVSPHALLADAALAVAPFPLPKTPVRLTQYWTFKTSAGDLPTLPVVVFQLYALDVYDAFVRLLEEVSPYYAERLPTDGAALVAGGHAERVIRTVRDMVQHEAALADRMLERLHRGPHHRLNAEQVRRLTALLELYRGPASHYLDFYGPPRTIPTVPYHTMLDDTAPPLPAVDLRGKAVFVGLSEQFRFDQKDGFYTVFSQESGADLSGVEIAATAFANLLETRPVRPLAPQWHLAALLLWGLAVGALAGLLPPAGAAPCLVAAAGLYFVAALHGFQTAGKWPPLVVPLFVQAPLALLAAAGWSYLRASRERKHIRQALGYYLPPRVADQLVAQVGDLRTRRDLAYGTCLSTDAHQYTALAERLDPQTLAAFMNEYYAAIFEPVKRHGGIVSDVVGDSMLAIWAGAQPDPELRHRACWAALDIATAVDRFNRQSGVQALATRVGLQSGPMVLGNVGAIDHYEYRAVGDIVNAANRLEGLNKRLGTRVLATADVVYGLDDVLTRELGTFLLPGKSKPLVVHELFGREHEADADRRRLCVAFARGLAAFRAGCWDDAMGSFRACLEISEDDGPSLFYARLCAEHKAGPMPEAWDAIVRIDVK